MSYEKNRLLIQTLRECVEACNYCFQACLKEENVKMMVECIRLDRECADMCAFLERELTIDSSFAHDLAEICSKICEACGNECLKHEHDHCQKCAESCFKCAKACKDIA